MGFVSFIAPLHRAAICPTSTRIVRMRLTLFIVIRLLGYDTTLTLEPSDFCEFEYSEDERKEKRICLFNNAIYVVIRYFVKPRKREKQGTDSNGMASDVCADINIADIPF